MKQESLGPLPSQPATIRPGGGRKWVHPFKTKGRYTTRRNLIAVGLLILFYATPWLRINGAPFLKLSFLNSSFVIFGNPILIYEFHYFVLLILLLLLSLALASAVYGRIWCGYACPQTIFIEQVLGRIETFFEGPAAQRLAQVGKKLTLRRLAAKVGKQGTFAVVSLSFAFTLVAIFTGPELLLFDHNKNAWMVTLILGGLAWFDGAYWREQFCHLVCPYGRLQGIMQDHATRTIGYDLKRGEPRRRGKSRDGAGDCIDCGLCVRVCPSGIDIRQGAQQLECIGCARCIDACNGVMASIGTPQGLIRYDAVGTFEENVPSARPKIWRTRIAIYGMLWLVLAIGGAALFVTRRPFVAKALSTSGTAPYIVAEGRIKNLFMIKVANQERGDETFVVRVEPSSIVQFHLETPPQIGPLGPGKEGSLPVLISGDPSSVGAIYHIEVTGQSSGHTERLQRQFLGPNNIQE